MSVDALLILQCWVQTACALQRSTLFDCHSLAASSTCMLVYLETDSAGPAESMLHPKMETKRPKKTSCSLVPSVIQVYKDSHNQQLLSYVLQKCSSNSSLRQNNACDSEENHYDVCRVNSQAICTLLRVKNQHFVHRVCRV